jgi:hypothetical protein
MYMHDVYTAANSPNNVLGICALVMTFTMWAVVSSFRNAPDAWQLRPFEIAGI